MYVLEVKMKKILFFVCGLILFYSSAYAFNSSKEPILQVLSYVKQRNSVGLHAAVQKGPLGELAPCGLPGPGGKEGAEPLLEHHRGAVAVEFHAVLAGVAVAGGKGDGQNLIHGRAVLVQERAKDHGAAGMGGEGPPVGRAEHRVGDGEGLRTGEAEDADGGDLISRRDSGNGVHSDLPLLEFR